MLNDHIPGLDVDFFPQEWALGGDGFLPLLLSVLVSSM
jgi:hypothetical protein